MWLAPLECPRSPRLGPTFESQNVLALHACSVLASSPAGDAVSRTSSCGSMLMRGAADSSTILSKLSLSLYLISRAKLSSAVPADIILVQDASQAVFSDADDQAAQHVLLATAEGSGDPFNAASAFIFGPTACDFAARECRQEGASILLKLRLAVFRLTNSRHQVT